MKDLYLLMWLNFQSAIIGAWLPDCHQQTGNYWCKATGTDSNASLARRPNPSGVAQITKILPFA